MVTKPPRWYFSFRSPYSWLAHHDLLAHYPDVASSIEWIPFWEPDETSRRLLAEAGGHFPYVPMSREKHRYMLQDVRRLALARDTAVSWPIDRTPCWEVAHLAYLVADAAGHGRAFAAAVYRARWELGRDISDRSTVAAIATELGLDGSRVANAVDDGQVRHAGASVLLRIADDAVFGVPFFITGYDKYWGVDRLPAFVKAVRANSPGPETNPDGGAAGDPAPAADQGHAGGCG